jgi:hypothetical protein
LETRKRDVERYLRMIDPHSNGSEPFYLNGKKQQLKKLRVSERAGSRGSTQTDAAVAKEKKEKPGQET